MRVGIGYDIHPLIQGQYLVLGGVEIPYTHSLDGWSDADVLTHAIIDALLGAATLGDIGSHFPSGEAPYKDIPSLKLLRETGDKLKSQNWCVGNIDATVIIEKPRLRDFVNQIRQKLSGALGIEVSKVSIKASTANGMGFIGRGDGVSACAVVMIEHTQK